MSFDFFNKERITKQIYQLAQLRYKNIFSVTDFITYEDNGINGLTSPCMDNPVPMKLGDRWKGVDKYLWLCFTVEFSDSFIDKDVVGIFDFGRTGGGTNDGFESLIYVDKKPYQGVDSNHGEVFFNVTSEKKSFDIMFRLWTGLNGGGKTHEVEHQLKRADFGILDKNTDKLYFIAKNIINAEKILSNKDPNKSLLINELVQSFNLIDFSEPGSKEFYSTVKLARNYLKKIMDGNNKMPVNVSLIGHTHIDVAWLWRLCHTREKAARSFSTVNRLMERYPEYKFMQTQAQLYEYVKEDYPEIYQHIKKRVAEGRWEPSGSMWVECDCNVTSGESIVRQILYGKRFFEKEFDFNNDYLWLPDVFGYSWALPQILKLSEIKTFVTTKISWNDTNKMPYDTFKWRGIDGSEVNAHLFNSPNGGYNGNPTPENIMGLWDFYSSKDLNTDLLLSFGYGDGGGGVNREMLENIPCIDKLPGVPNVKIEFATDYLYKLNRTISNNPRNAYVPTWDGELYLEFHRGTYTSQAYNKMMNRRLEFLVREAEMLASLAMIKKGTAYPQNKIFDAWKIILRNQFHDIIPGSSIHEVYEDSRIEYAQAEKLLNQVIADSTVSVTTDKLTKEDEYTVINTLGFNRTSMATLPNGDEILIKNVPALSGKFVKVERMRSTKLDIVKSISSNFYYISWNKSGHITSIFDKISNREVISGNANVIRVYEDKPRCYDAWELESTYEGKCEVVDSLISVSAYQTNSYVCVVFNWKYRKSTIKQEMLLYDHTARIDFKTVVDWQDREKIMKVDFPVDIRATDARYDIQFGNVKRPIVRNTTWDMAKFEVVAHKWADLSETGYGVAILNNCKYGHSIKDNVMSLTLLKSANDPDYSADLGEQCFTYALYPHVKEWFEAGIIEEAFDLNVPLTVVKGNCQFSSLISIDNKNITIDTIKKAEDENAVIVRMYEHAGSRGEVNLKLDFAIKNWCECNLLEHRLSECNDGEVVFTIKPYEIKTIKISL